MTDLYDTVLALRDQLIQEHGQAPGLFGEMARIETLLAETYRTRVFYELLQNSDDAGATVVTVDLRRPGTVAWANNGRPFNPADVEALCRSASSTKHRGAGTIGYRGIGFKAVAAIASSVSVRSNGVSILFDRSEAAGVLGALDVGAVPLLRVPARVEREAVTEGAEFVMRLAVSATSEDFSLNPLALPFLRHLRQVEILHPANVQSIDCRTESDTVALTVDGEESTFNRLRNGNTTVLIPSNAHAERLTGLRGRLACFLPLEDELSLPVIASGDLLTDPSRTHAVVSDPSTRTVIEQIGALLAGALRDGHAAVRDRLWSLLLRGEDLRTVALSGENTIAGMLVSAIKRAFTQNPLPFAFAEVPLAAEDVPVVFPGGAPADLYDARHSSSARALRTVFGARTLRVHDLLEQVDPDSLTASTRQSVADRVIELARAEGRALTPREQRFVGAAKEPHLVKQLAATPVVQVTANEGDQLFSGAIQRWRAAEVAVLEFLNSKGWRLRDVSHQNVGYDLDGLNPDGDPVHLEVKKVDSRDSRFALTNNEMAFMIAASSRYFLAIVIGDGPGAQLALLDPLRDNIPRERVCRRWEWEYTDWSPYAKLLG
jgi:hypothetical protein